MHLKHVPRTGVGLLWVESEVWWPGGSFGLCARHVGHTAAQGSQNLQSNVERQLVLALPVWVDGTSANVVYHSSQPLSLVAAICLICGEWT